MAKTGADNKETNENISKVKFSIPVVYPTFGVKERPNSPTYHVGRF